MDFCSKDVKFDRGRYKLNYRDIEFKMLVEQAVEAEVVVNLGDDGLFVTQVFFQLGWARCGSRYFEDV